MSKVVISHEGLKRTLDLPFELCSDRATLELICAAIRDKLEASDFLYGWVSISLKTPIVTSQPPIPWKA